MACFPVTWMFEDAGRSVLGSYTQAHLNPLRWSISLSFKEAVAALKEELCEEERPVRINLTRNGSSHQIKFETILDAVDYLQHLVLEEEKELAVEVVQTASPQVTHSETTVKCESTKLARVEVEEEKPRVSIEESEAASEAVVAKSPSKKVEEVGVSQSIIETFEEEKPSMNIEAVDASVDAVIAALPSKKAEEQQAADMPAAEAAAVMEVARHAAVEEPAAEPEIAEQAADVQAASLAGAMASTASDLATMQRSKTEGCKQHRYAEMTDGDRSRSVNAFAREETSLGAAMAATASEGAPMQKSRTEGGSKDRRFDFGFSLKLKRCSVCRKLGLNRGDKESQKIYCVACFDDIKC